MTYTVTFRDLRADFLSGAMASERAASCSVPDPVSTVYCAVPQNRDAEASRTVAADTAIGVTLHKPVTRLFNAKLSGMNAKS